jgi:CRISPR-associated protein Csd1
MILKRLCEFAGRIPDLPPSMYSLLEFKWQVELDTDGTYRGITRLTGDEKGKTGLRLMAPNMKRAGTKAPALLLADNARYALGAGSSPPSKSEHFVRFYERAASCAEWTGEPAVCAVVQFLDWYKDSDLTLPEELLPSDNVLFRVGSQRPTDLSSVQRFWVSENSDEGAATGQCLVCGTRGPVDRLSPIAIKGVPGGQSTGMAIVSANKDAFESYGAQQALIAPTCRSCGEGYANAINYMIRSEKHRVYVGPTVFIFWTAADSEFDVVSFLSQPQPEEVRELISSFRTGKLQHGLDLTAFYALSLSAAGGRVVVRDWLDTTVPTAQENLARWFELQRICADDGSDGAPYGVFPLAASLYLKPNDQMVANVPRSLVRCALSGGPLPTSLLAQAVARNRAEQSVTRNRAAMLKAVMLSQVDDSKEGYMERLETSCKSPGYLCGRLMAELESAQKLAVNPRSTLVDRFYGAASSAPATVFGYLLRDFQAAHMGKLRKEKPGAYNAIDIRVQDILQSLREFPKTLSLKEQALFALGYYHQKADNRANAIAAKNAKTENNAEEKQG